MNRCSLSVHLAAFFALISAFSALLDAAEPPRRAPVVARGGNLAEWPKNDSYVGGTTGNRRIAIDARRGVLANDQLPDSLNKGLSDRELVAELVAPPKNAAHFALHADGSFIYEPQPGFVGLDTFRYGIKGMDVVPASAMIVMPQIPVAIRVKTDADGKPIQPRELANRKNSNGAGFVVYPVNGPVNVELVMAFSIAAQVAPASGKPPSAALGHGALGGDYTLGFTAAWTINKITIPANSEGVEIDLTVLPDKLVEGPEYVCVQLQHPSGEAGKVSFHRSAESLTIQDNDYWKWDKQAISGSYKPKDFNPKLGDWLAPLGGAWFVDSRTGKRVWDDGDSTFEPSASYRIWDDRVVVKVSARWEKYYNRWAYVERIVNHPDDDLDLAFDFDTVNGNISVRSGSGGGGSPSLLGGRVGISYRYKFDNSGALTKVATVSYHVLAEVGGTMASGLGTSGNGWKGGSYVRHNENSDGGGTALSESSVATFTLRATEDP
jgi:hypothetical protein